MAYSNYFGTDHLVVIYIHDVFKHKKGGDPTLSETLGGTILDILIFVVECLNLCVHVVKTNLHADSNSLSLDQYILTVRHVLYFCTVDSR